MQAQQERLKRGGLEIVGDNPLLYGTLGAAYWQHINAGVGPVEHYLHRAEECVVKVFRLEPDSAPGHYVRGLIRLTRGNIQEAVRELSRALVLDPDNSEAFFMHAALLTAAGKDSAAETTRLLEIDPLTPQNLLVPAWGHLVQGRFSLAVDECRRWHERDPESPLAALFLGDALARNDRVDDAGTTFERLAARFPQTMFGQIGLFLRHALRGNKAQALEAVSPTSAEAARWDLQYLLGDGHRLRPDRRTGSGDRLADQCDSPWVDQLSVSLAARPAPEKPSPGEAVHRLDGAGALPMGAVRSVGQVESYPECPLFPELGRVDQEGRRMASLISVRVRGMRRLRLRLDRSMLGSGHERRVRFDQVVDVVSEEDFGADMKLSLSAQRPS